MSSSHVCVDTIFDPSVRLVEIGLIVVFNYFTGVPGKMKCTISLASKIASISIISNTDVEYAVSIGMGVRLLLSIVFSSSYLS